METREKRSKRLKHNSPIEIIETLLNGIDNFFNREIAVAGERNLWSFVILGIHATALTIEDGLFNLKGEAAFVHYCSNFIDNANDTKKISEIAPQIHTYRNIVAHHWFSDFAYTFGLDAQIDEKWISKEGVTILNPSKYLDAYLKAFDSGGSIWRYDRMLSNEDLEGAKTRLLDKYFQFNND